MASGHDPDKLVKRHIEVLHRYNEVKDATQMLIGRVNKVLSPLSQLMSVRQYQVPDRQGRS